MKRAHHIPTRHPENPIIKPSDIDGAMAVFNPGPAMYQGKTILVLSVYKFGVSTVYPADPRSAASGILAESADGVHFTIRDQPLIDLTRASYPFNQLTNPAIIDYRVTQIGDTYYLVAPVDIAPGGPVGLLGQTKDFTTY